MKNIYELNNLTVMEQSYNYFKQFGFILILFTLIECKTLINDSKKTTGPENQNKSELAQKADTNQRFTTDTIVKKYEGLVNGGTRFENGKMVPSPNETIVIRNNKEYNTFINRILTKEVSMKNPALPSADPLLKRPVIDFNKNTMLVCIRHDGIYGQIKLLDIKYNDNPVEVSVSFLPLSEESKMYAQPTSGIGKYTAYLVKRTNKEIKFVVSEN